MLIFEGMLLIYSDHAAIFNNIDRRKFLLISLCALSVAMVSAARSGRAGALKLQKTAIRLSHKHFTSQIFDSGFRRDTFLFEVHEKVRL